jgi:serine/threonine protein kinase
MQQLLETLNYLHKSEVSHRDIKLENVLYDQKNRQTKLIDFGVCRRFKKRGALFDMWTITGTLYYRAP